MHIKEKIQATMKKRVDEKIDIKNAIHQSLNMFRVQIFAGIIKQFLNSVKQYYQQSHL
jgi:hypothetical protein